MNNNYFIVSGESDGEDQDDEEKGDEREEEHGGQALPDKPEIPDEQNDRENAEKKKAAELLQKLDMEAETAETQLAVIFGGIDGTDGGGGNSDAVTSAEEGNSNDTGTQKLVIDEELDPKEPFDEDKSASGEVAEKEKEEGENVDDQKVKGASDVLDTSSESISSEFLNALVMANPEVDLGLNSSEDLFVDQQ